VASSRKSSVKRSTKPASGSQSRPSPRIVTAADRGTSRGEAAFRAKVRMYRQGLGDCFLITLGRGEGEPYYIVIDCGVILGTKDSETIMNAVVKDIADTTGGHVNLMVATHEHWDHLSGMLQARELWQKIRVDEVWLGWTEDPKDKLAQQLRGEREALRAALTMAANRMRMAGSAESADEVAGLLEFFGAAGRATTAGALEAVKELSQNVRFRLPDDPPVTLEGTGVKAYVLGPPRDLKLIRKTNPSAKEPETYGIDAVNVFLSALALDSQDADLSAPFDDTVRIPLEMARQIPFFQDCYWGEDSDSSEKDQSWRRIDASWLDASTSLALQLDNSTNNTSLVIALELEGGDVLLFAADAQVGNWLSWQDLSWDVDGKTVTGPDLLRRAIFYKVGHHGSHNATLSEHGLEEMTGLKTAFIPVDYSMALTKHWDRIPLNQLLKRLDEITNNGVVRSDRPAPSPLADHITATQLFYEIAF
jgi:hypothetical protein